MYVHPGGVTIHWEGGGDMVDGGGFIDSFMSSFIYDHGVLPTSLYLLR